MKNKSSCFMKCKFKQYTNDKNTPLINKELYKNRKRQFNLKINISIQFK